MSLGSDWQSVDRHHVSLPLVIVNFCVVVPTFIVQSDAPWFVNRMDSLGFWPPGYVVWSVTASTDTFADVHGTAVATAACVAVGVEVGVGVGVEVGVARGAAVFVGDGVAAAGTGSAVMPVVPTVGEDVGAAALPAHGRAMRSQTPATTRMITRSRTSLRRRYTAGECRRRGVGLVMHPG
jgi:hypothetical protein